MKRMATGPSGRFMLLGMVLGTSLLLGACAPKTIGHVLADPQRYATRDATIRGEVVQSYSVLGRGAYELRDRTGRLWIVSDRGVPRHGTRVQVKGKVRDFFDAGVLMPAGTHAGVVMRESSRKATD